ncbi:ecto-ADP-ribosyltransferase 5-like [Monodelphis domestica]|uniref:ecto-ADP-ribosyltransferase 5-like n=1 Tax=Monodelphis domestica TaxID=13616 RepID=UPI0024E209C9|nr:ecto-ADP-ribosyltransferase 5-like [Monodelphis domestica]XP_056651009.1 ecto-ADP-ribosyltransferase 5-like [Monodelphis domestica]
MKSIKVISIVTVLIFQLITSGEAAELPKYVISLESNAFGDQYVGCEENMETKAKELLAQERAMNSNFSKVWEKAEIKWEKLSPDKKRMEKLYEVAVIAYTMEEPKIYPTFNRAVRECCGSLEAYMKDFHFKAFHFYLTRAVKILRKPGFCQKVYRGISVKQLPDGSGEMRFGQFASTSLKQGVALIFTDHGTGTFYDIYTCQGALIQHLSVYPEEKEVLIPPYELFDVASFSESEGLQNVMLKSKRTFSKFNCAYLQDSGKMTKDPGLMTTILFSGILILFFQDHSQILSWS